MLPQKNFVITQGDSSNVTFHCQRKELIPYDLSVNNNFQVHARLIGSSNTVAGDFDVEASLGTNGRILLPAPTDSDKAQITIELLSNFTKTLQPGYYSLAVVITESGSSPEPLRYELPTFVNYLNVRLGRLADLA